MISAAELLQAAYAGAEDAGSKIAGLARVESSTVLYGPKDAPLELGQRVELMVRQAADGRLLPKLDDAGPHGPRNPAARWLVYIDVYPTIEENVDFEARVVWVAHARREDVATRRVVGVGKSGMSFGEHQVLVDGRPAHEYGNDPAYHEAIRGAEADGPREAVAAALRDLPPPPTAAAPPPKRRALIAGGVATIAAAGIGFALFSGGDETNPSAATPATVAPPATVDDEASPTVAPAVTPATGVAPATSDAPAATTPPEPVHIFTATVLVYSGSQGAVETWNVGDATLIGRSTLPTPVNFSVLTNPAGPASPDGSIPFLALANFACPIETEASCRWILEVYEHVGGEQHSSAAEGGATPFGSESTFLAEVFDIGALVEATEEGCTASITQGRLPAHPTLAEDLGIGVYSPSTADAAHTDTLFTELGPPTELTVVIVESGDDTAIALATPDAMVSGCFSSGEGPMAWFFDELDPPVCEAEQVDEELEFCDGAAIDLNRLAEVLRTMPPTPAIEAVLQSFEAGNFVGFGGDEVGLVADALAVSILLGP